MKKVSLYEEFINEKREDVGKYNTVKKAIKAIKKEYGPTPTEQSVASFINDNYYDVTEVERGDDDPAANDKIADLVAFYKFDIDDWEIAWADAQNESVVNEASKDRMIKQIERALKDGDSIFKLPMATQKYYNKNKSDFESVVTEAKNTIGLAFKDEDDYNGFVEFIKDEKGSIKKDFGWDSKTKSWEVIMDVKVLDSIYGEGTPGNKESGWYGALPGDFESVIIESQVTEAKSDKVEIDIDFAGSKADLRRLSKKYNIEADEYNPGKVMLKGDKKDILAYLTSPQYDMDIRDIEDLFPELLESVNEAKFVKDFNRDVLNAKTKEEVLELYPNAEFFIGKSDHFFGELDGNLFFKAYYTKAQQEFEIKSVYSQKGSNYVHLYNESVVTEARFNYKETGLSGQNLKDVKDGIRGIKNALKRGNESAVISNYDLVQQRLQQYGGPDANEFLEKIKQLAGLDESVVTESKKSEALADAITKSIMKIDDTMSYADFALAVGQILRDDYGQHNFMPFMKVLHNDLGIK
jgi:hypothetical protein